MLISSAGAVAAMFWVDADLGSDVYLDGRKYETTMCHLLLIMHFCCSLCFCMLDLFPF